MKLWDVADDSQEIREKEETHQLDHPILSYTPNRFKTFQTQKWEYLSNECAELDEQGHPGNKSVRRICGSKSERSDAEMHEARREDFKGGPCHQNANISVTTAPIRTIQASTGSLHRVVQA
ncbi:hypothetical protein BKA82DRAFT_36219 [Pisolithus tinctorius]|uniref:Uncharacterized protein n=1 Tax=Pisolithus tinctorius Marx 270 TaxID=870435 RepID=A0A0C3J6H6_PISTI|nr:hypothetical protein BKA82DRAFT_36219 [Pisolithus tinctorius]KIN93296.1 hypothetical protein M404DRAFT_36219 [Pisolithus tinctorius Marx 270]